MPKIEKDLLKVKGSDGQWHYIPAVGGGDTPTWGAVKDKPFESLGDGLSVENGVLSVPEGGGGSSVFYIKVTATNDGSGQTTYSADKTAAEIYEALNAKAAMYVVLGSDDIETFIPILSRTVVSNGYTILYFAIPSRGVTIVLTPNDGIPTIEEIEYYELADSLKFYEFDNEDGSVSIELFYGTIETLQSPNIVPIALYNIANKKEYSVSTIDTSGDAIVLCFDDISGKKVRKITIDNSTTPATLTYSEEPLSTSVNITYDEKTGNLQIGG